MKAEPKEVAKDWYKNLRERLKHVKLRMSIKNVKPWEGRVQAVRSPIYDAESHLINAREALRAPRKAAREGYNVWFALEEANDFVIMAEEAFHKQFG